MRSPYLVRAVDEGEALGTYCRPRSDVRALRAPGESDTLACVEVDEGRACHGQNVLLGGHHAAREASAASGREGGMPHHQRVEDAW